MTGLLSNLLWLFLTMTSIEVSVSKHPVFPQVQSLLLLNSGIWLFFLRIHPQTRCRRETFLPRNYQTQPYSSQPIFITMAFSHFCRSEFLFCQCNHGRVVIYEYRKIKLSEIVAAMPFSGEVKKVLLTRFLHPLIPASRFQCPQSFFIQTRFRNGIFYYLSEADMG